MTTKTSRWRMALLRPNEDPDLLGELPPDHRPGLQRVHRAVVFVNNCLLGPMVTLIAVELIVGQNVHKLLHDDLLMVGFCASFAVEWLLGLKLDLVRCPRATFTVISVAACSALAIRAIEPQTVGSFADAQWWSVVTISTVGYGDIYPVSDAGRAVGIALIVFTIGVYGYVAGLTTGAVTHPEDALEHQETLDAIAGLEAKIDRLTRQLGLAEVAGGDDAAAGSPNS